MTIGHIQEYNYTRKEYRISYPIISQLVYTNYVYKHNVMASLRVTLTHILRKAEGRIKEGDSTFKDLLHPSENASGILVVQWRVYDL